MSDPTAATVVKRPREKRTAQTPESSIPPDLARQIKLAQNKALREAEVQKRRILKEADRQVLLAQRRAEAAASKATELLIKSGEQAAKQARREADALARRQDAQAIKDAERAKRVEARRMKKEEMYEAIKTRLRGLKMPIDLKDYEQAFKVKRTTAHLRLNELIERKELKRVGYRKFGWADVDYDGVVDRPVSDSWETLLERLSDLDWPMTRNELMGAIASEYKEKKEWVGKLIDEGHVIKLGLAEYIYVFADLRDPGHINAPTPYRAETDDQDYQKMLRRMPLTFSAAMFGHLIGKSAKHTASTLARMEKSEWIKRVERGIYSREETVWPEEFGIGHFAYHFGLGAAEAAEFLNKRTQGKRMEMTVIVKPHPGRRPSVMYRAEPDIRAAYEELLHPNQEVKAHENQTLEQLVEDLPTLPWPMTAKEYAEHYGLANTTARSNLDRLRLMGLVEQTQEFRGRYMLYRYVERDKPLIDARKARKLIRHNKRSDEARELMGLPKRNTPEAPKTPKAKPKQTKFKAPPPEQAAAPAAPQKAAPRSRKKQTA